MAVSFPVRITSLYRSISIPGTRAASTALSSEAVNRFQKPKLDRSRFPSSGKSIEVWRPDGFKRFLKQKIIVRRKYLDRVIARDAGYPIDNIIVRATVVRQSYIYDLPIPCKYSRQKP